MPFINTRLKQDNIDKLGTLNFNLKPSVKFCVILTDPDEDFFSLIFSTANGKEIKNDVNR
jgi:hypothetical protein